ncbi:MAG: DUF2520 domain-containing protein [Alphaproteobacteria bacterium]|nr:DUF2520 domain-containing protein [Alphaproteobacteria bacterium]
MTYLLIGSGRVATHVKHYLSLKGIPLLEWNRKNHSIEDLREKTAQADTVLLAIKDGAIREFRDAHFKDFKGTVVHFSGSLSVEGIESFHPLMTFGPSLYDLDFYERIYFAAASKKRFKEIFPALSNPVFELMDKNKALYHALCVMSGNFPQILWQACLQKFEELNVPQEAVGLYLEKNLENFLAAPGKSLTGPLARGDTATIEKNIDALPARMAKLYQAFVKYFLDRNAKTLGEPTSHCFF